MRNTTTIKAAVVGSAFYAISAGVIVIALKNPTLLWLRSADLNQVETVVGIFARASIAVGAATLLVMIILARLSRRSNASKVHTRTLKEFNNEHA